MAPSVSLSRKRTCQFCGRTFSKQNHLERHITSHTRERPFQCADCGRTYTRHDTLLRHQREHKVSSVANTNAKQIEATSHLHSESIGTLIDIEPAIQGQQISIASTEHLFHSSNDRPDNTPVLMQQGWHTNTQHASSDNAAWNPSAPTNDQIATGILSVSPYDDYENQLPPWLIHDELNLDLDGFALSTTDQPWGFNTDPRDAEFVQQTPKISRLWFTDVRDSQGSQIASGIATPRNGHQVDEDYRAALHNRLSIKATEHRLPSTDFLNSCIRLYFLRFHPVFPVVHMPTFRPSKVNSMLLLSICSVGGLFTGSETSLERSTQIFQRLQKAILAKWDTLMAREGDEAISLTQAALIGQTFAMLSGNPKHLAQAEAFQGTVISWARRIGAFRARQSSPQELLSNINAQETWHAWARTETLIRIVHGLHIHDAELAHLFQHEPLLRHNARPISYASSDIVFAAADPQEWQRKLQTQTPQHFDETTPSDLSSLTPNETESYSSDALSQRSFSLYTLLDSINAHILDLRLANSLIPPHDAKLQDQLMIIHKILDGKDNSLNIDFLQAWILWHLNFMSLCTDFNLLERIVGRDQDGASPEELSTIKVWAQSPEATRSVLHSVLLLRRVEEISLGQELALHTARAMFEAGLVLFCFKEFASSKSSERSAKAIFKELRYPETDYMFSHEQKLFLEALGRKDGRPSKTDVEGTLCRIMDLLKSSGHWGIARKFAGILNNLIRDHSD